MKLIDRLLADGSAKVHTECGQKSGTGHSVPVTPPPAVVVADSVTAFAGNYNYGPIRCPINGLWVEINVAPMGFRGIWGARVTEQAAESDWWEVTDARGLHEVTIRPFTWMRPECPWASPYHYGFLVNDQGEEQKNSLISAWECVRDISEEEYREALGTRIGDGDGRNKLVKNGDLAQAYLSGVVSHLVCHALGFMNVKNVHLDPHEPPPRLSRAHQRRTGGPPLVKWSTIRLPRPARLSASGPTLGRGEVPLHLVRGHFKTYTPDHPLFGHRVGTYWWPAALRGDPEKGERLHEYKLDPQATTTGSS